jgi:uncharacterized protein
MKRPVVAAVLAASCVFLAQAADEPTGPSFDCAKASTEMEHFLCDMPGLGWYDRQMAKAYKVTKQSLDADGKAALKETQDEFLAARNSCKTADAYGCVVSAYSQRLEALVETAGREDFAAGSFSSENGTLGVVRYPDGLVALTVSTVGGGDHTCAFETDSAKEDASGNYVYARTYDGWDETCRITVTPAGNNLTLTSEGCQYWCGMRATLDGEYSRTAP